MVPLHDGIELDIVEEAKERQQAELDFLASAYSNDEAWCDGGNGENDKIKVYRRIILHSSGVCLVLEIVLSSMYPIDGKAVTINGSVESTVIADGGKVLFDGDDVNGGNKLTKHAISKLAYDNLANFLSLCRNEAKCAAEDRSEAIFAIFSCAQAWYDDTWIYEVDRLDEVIMQRKGTEELSFIPSGTASDKCQVFGRRLIYSHHIIAKTKRKGIVELANDLNLSGCSKYGWPGLVILEGEESACIEFIETIRKWRWQYLTVRGEQQIEIPAGEDLDDHRGFANKGSFVELGENMSEFAAKCRESGLVDLFKTCMKIYNSEDVTSSDLDCKDINSKEDGSPFQYGSAVLVDHMNNEKGYQKLLQRSSLECQCELFIFSLETSDFSDSCKCQARFLVLVLGVNKDSVQRLMKFWRTTKVDVDKRGHACLERMMQVLVEGVLSSRTKFSRTFLVTEIKKKADFSCLTFADVQGLFHLIGGDPWTYALGELKR